MSKSVRSWLTIHQKSFWWNHIRRPTAELEAELAELKATLATLEQSSLPASRKEMLAVLRGYAEMIGQDLPKPSVFKLYESVLAGIPALFLQLAAGRLLRKYEYGQRLPMPGEFYQQVADEVADVRHWRTRLRCGIESLEEALARQPKKSPKPSNGASAST